LLLFDTYILESYRFREVLEVVKVAGVDGTINLLQSGALKVFCDQIGLAERTSPAPPRNEYAFAKMALADRVGFLDRCFSQLHGFSSLPPMQMRRMREAIEGALVEPFPQAAWAEAIEQSLIDFTNEAVLSDAVIQSLERQRHQSVDKRGLKVIARRTGGMNVLVTSNLKEQFLLNEEDERTIIGSALRAVSGLAFCFQHMKAYSAISGLRGEEIRLLGSKVSFLLRELDPKLQDEQFRRVIAIAGLPEFGSATKVDMDKFLSIRESRECAEFRQWLRSAESETDAQIRERLTNVREKLGSMVQGRAGKTVRFLVTSGVGLIPVIGNVAGPVLSGLDTFVVDKLLKSSGPISFISTLYPSLF